MSETTTRPRWMTTAEMAKVVRQVLKAEFPGTKFSVRSDNYSGGSSIRVHYDSTQVYSRDVDDKVKMLQGATFDGMIDLKSYRNVTLPSGEVIQGGADFIFVSNEQHGWEQFEAARRRGIRLSA
jgi:hypothetical protein